MRVVAGTRGGRRLSAPPGRAVRPTSDRVREALFSILGADVVGARVLDCYAGSGALGIEALSRGAEHAVFVESDRRVTRTIRSNLAALELSGDVVVADVARAATRLPPGDFDLVLADPPYGHALDGLVGLLDELRGTGRLPVARVVVERDRRTTDPLPGWLAVDDLRTYGDTALLLLRVQSDEERP